MTVEPVFGIIKEAMGFRRFSLRGKETVAAEWSLVCGAYNLRRLFALALKAKEEEKIEKEGDMTQNNAFLRRITQMVAQVYAACYLPTTCLLAFQPVLANLSPTRC